MKKLFLFVVLNYSLLSWNYGQNTNIKFEKYVLANGLKVILHQDTTVPVVAVTALYHVGSKNEDTSRTGFAHFFEHLLFEGTVNIKKGEFAKYISNAGGERNAFTTQDKTFYYEVFPDNQVDLGLWLESERMMHAIINQDGVNTQREVVKEEKRLRFDNRPYGSLLTETLKRGFKKHPYRWAPIGSLDHLNKASLSEFIDFYKTYYVPNNCVLTIAGNFNTERLKKQIDRYFSEIPKGLKPIHRTQSVEITEGPLGGEVRDSIEDNIQLPAVIQGYRAPGLLSEDYYVFKILSTLLSGGESSRFNKILVDKKQISVGTFANPLLNEDGGLMINVGIVNVGLKASELEKGMDSITDDLKINLISKKELDKVKNQIKTDLVEAKRTMLGVAQDLAEKEVYFKDANLINTELKNIDKVTPEDIMRIAKKYFQKDNRVVLYYLPKSKKNKSKSKS